MSGARRLRAPSAFPIGPHKPAFIVSSSRMFLRRAEKLGVPADFEAEVERALTKGLGFREPPGGVARLRGPRFLFVDLGVALVRVKLGDVARGGAQRVDVVAVLRKP